jgi:hypothetical protein
MSNQANKVSKQNLNNSNIHSTIGDISQGSLIGSKNNVNDNRRAKSTMRATSSMGSNGGSQQKPSSMANMTKMRAEDSKLATQAVGASNLQIAMA